MTLSALLLSSFLELCNNILEFFGDISILSCKIKLLLVVPNFSEGQKCDRITPVRAFVLPNLIFFVKTSDFRTRSSY